MSVETPLLHDGAMVLSTASDARRSSITGTTLAGPNGSGQFLAVFMSTSVDLTIGLCSTLFGAAGSTVEGFYGILQNAPGPGVAADVGVLGVTKAVAGATITRGQQLQTSSTVAGVLVSFAAGNGARIGIARESAVVGQVFSVALYGFGQGGGST